MFEKFTDRARKVMALANQEAQRFNHEYIGTEHLLLGLVKEGTGVGANVLKNLGLDLHKVRAEVEKLTKPGPEMVTVGKLPQTPRAKKVIEYSIEESRKLHHNYVGTEHLLLGLLREREGVAAQVLTNMGLKADEVREELLNLLGAGMDDTPRSAEQAPRETQPKTPALHTFGRDLTQQAREGQLPEIIGREREIDGLMQVLRRHSRNSALLVGPPRVGKRAVVHGLCRRLADEVPCPTPSAIRRVVELDLGLIGPTVRAGQAGERIRAVVNECGRTAGVVLLLDAPDVLSWGLVSHEHRVCLSLLADSLLRQGVRCILTVPGGVEIDDLPVRRLFEACTALRVEPLAAEVVRQIVQARRPVLADHHKVRITDDAVHRALALAETKTRQPLLPRTPLDLLDLAAAGVGVAPPPEIRDLTARIERTRQDKDTFVRQAAYDRAAKARDLGQRLLAERDALLERWQEARKALQVGPKEVDEAFRLLTGIDPADVTTPLEYPPGLPGGPAGGGPTSA